MTTARTLRIRRLNLIAGLHAAFDGRLLVRSLWLLLIGTAMLFGPAGVRPAEAVTLRDIVELSRAGLADEVLVALIETDGTVFTLTPAQIVELKQAGVSEKVLVAMLRQGRTPSPEPGPVASPAPEMPDQQPDFRLDPPPPSNVAPAQTTVVVVPTFVPFFIPFVQAPLVSCPPGAPAAVTPPAGLGRFLNNGSPDFGRFINTGFPDHRPIRVWGAVSTCLRK